MQPQKNLSFMDSAEITDADLMMLASVYNEILAKVDPWKYTLKFTNGYNKKTWYRELFNLCRTINKVGARPREYIQAQISEYKPSFKKGRRVPTIKMMASEEGIERYNKYLLSRGRIQSTVPVIKGNTLEFADSLAHKMMLNFGLQTEEDLFKAIFCIKQLPRDYVKEHPMFKHLCETHFYENTYGVAGVELLS